MRTILVGLALACMALPVAAQTEDENVARCVSSDPDTRIAACTALIQSGEWNSETEASWHLARGNAYNSKGLNEQAECL
jgi:hypothetical protein